MGGGESGDPHDALDAARRRFRLFKQRRRIPARLSRIEGEPDDAGGGDAKPLDRARGQHIAARGRPHGFQRRTHLHQQIAVVHLKSLTLTAKIPAFALRPAKALTYIRLNPLASPGCAPNEF